MLTVKALKVHGGGADRWLSDGAVRGSGALWARISTSGIGFYFRYTHQGKKKALPLGAFDASGAKGLTLEQAREKAGGVSKLYRDGITDLHGHFERERQAEERSHIAAEEAARVAAADAKQGTLGQLLDAYRDHLAQQAKQSYKDVKSIFSVHVHEAAPDLAARKANALTVEDFVSLLGQLVQAGKGRTADKLRSYLRAAYQLAIESKTNPAAPMALRGFGVSVNPIASIGALSQFHRARNRVLNAPELGAFLRRLDALGEGVQRDVLQLLLLLGGQRPAQLLRAKPTDVDLSASVITLYDGKGARTQPRRHVLPLVTDAGAILKRRIDAIDHTGVPLFSTDEKTVMRPETVSVLVTDIATEMVKAKESREPFQLRDIRRTCETMLASLKVSRDVRAELQSHGLGGVQKRHYDHYDYALEKRQALEKWSRHLAALKANKKASVVPLSRAREQVDAEVGS